MAETSIEPREPGPSMKRDVLFRNGRLYPVVGPRCSAMRVRGGRIVAMGETAELPAGDKEAEVVDLEGRFVMPAFIDAHLHFVWGSLYLGEVGLRDARSMAEVVARVAAYAERHPTKSYILGKEFSYGYPDIPGEAFHRSLLDAAVPDRPVYLKSGMAHAAWANTRALELAGIGRDTPDPHDGEIVRDAQGVPTGWLKEHASDPLDALFPQATGEELAEALRQGMREANRFGIARVQSAGFDDDMVPILAAMQERGELSLRFTLSNVVQPNDDPVEATAGLRRWRGEFDGSFLDARVVKFFLDGVLESHTGYMPEGYADRPGETGILLWEYERYARAVAAAQADGFQVWTHAIGTGAIEAALDAYEADGPRSRLRRPRIEHVEIPAARDITRFGAIGAIASFQPAMIYPRDQWMGMEGIWERRVGRDARARAFPIRSVLDAGGAVAFGTDWPIVDLAPLVGIRNAVLRRSRDNRPPGGWGPDQAVTVAEALHAYTLGAAFAAHRETEEGSLETGKLADFIVLSDDPTAVDPDAIPEIEVLSTFVGGRRVFQAPV